MLYNQFIEKIVLPIGACVTKNHLTSYLSYLRCCDRMDKEELEIEMLRKLDGVIRHAVSSSPYYSGLGIKLGDNVVENLQRFPVLTKEILRSKPNELLTVPKKGLIANFSSGSSGIPSTTFLSPEELGAKQATQLHWMNWAGYSSGDSVFQTGMSQRTWVKKIKDFFFRTQYISAYNLSETDMVCELKRVQRSGTLLMGYASSLYLLALVNDKYKLGVRFKAVSSLGDKLFDHYRCAIEQSFGCPVFDTYGCCEGFQIAATKDLPYYYVMTPNVYVEIVDDDGNLVPDGQLGHVLLTNLNAYAMPMIRYRLGDLAIKLPREAYPSKRELPYPLLQKIVGRDTDLIRCPSGKLIIVHEVTEIFDDLWQEFKQYRVIQHALEHIEIEYIAGEKYKSEMRKKVEQRFYNLSDETAQTFHISWKEVDYIPATKSGKPQVISTKIHTSLF